jgi:hypothetical protein
MEVGGLTVGVLALAGLFNNAVDCFEYVQLGRNFGKLSDDFIKAGQCKAAAIAMGSICWNERRYGRPAPLKIQIG